MAAALLLVSESVLATVRSDFAEVAVINGTASTQVTPDASSCSMDEADGGADELLDGAVISCSMDLGGLAMAEFYNALRELPDLQSDLRFPTGRTKSFASQSSTFTPLHCERKSYASCMEMRDMALAPKGVPPARGSAVAGDEVWNERMTLTATR